MNMRHHQRGMSILLGFFLLVVFAFMGLMGLKLLPFYLESFKVDQAMKGMIEEPNVADLSKKDIAFGIVRRLDIDGSYHITEHNWKDFVKITKDRRKVKIHVFWRKEAEFVGNVSIVADFDKTVTNSP
ncbi:MAG: hypothetical protein ACI8PT_001775 [Gammaproteobacteria bacterium]|jgi:hypothetical protein